MAADSDIFPNTSGLPPFCQSGAARRACGPAVVLHRRVSSTPHPELGSQNAGWDDGMKAEWDPEYSALISRMPEVDEFPSLLQKPVVVIPSYPIPSMMDDETTYSLQKGKRSWTVTLTVLPGNAIHSRSAILL